MTTNMQAIISQMTLEEKTALCTGVSALMFQKSAWDKHPEDFVEELLQQAHGMEPA